MDGWMDGWTAAGARCSAAARGVRNGDWNLSPLHVALNGQRASVTGVLAYKRDAATLPPLCRYLTDVFRVVRSWRVVTRCVSKVGYVGRCVLTLFVL